MTSVRSPALLRGAPLPGSRRAEHGFTLIELLSAMAILMIMVVMMGIVFTESDRSWVLGTSRTEVNSVGRAALAMLSHDLQYAVADDVLTFVVRSDVYRRTGSATNRSVSYSFTNDEACFVSLQNDSSDTNRTAREIFYWVRPVTNVLSSGRTSSYELVRSVGTNGTRNCYNNRLWYEDWPSGGAGRGSAIGVIAENVAGLAFFVPQPTVVSNVVNWPSEYRSLTSSNQLPEFVDVLLELVDKDTARQAANMIGSGLGGTNVLNLIDLNKKRFATRVYFHNRCGYKVR